VRKVLDGGLVSCVYDGFGTCCRWCSFIVCLDCFGGYGLVGLGV